MKIIGSIVLLWFFSLWTAQTIGAAEPKADVESPREQVVLRWLGTVGWEVRIGKIIVLIDPFLTRKDLSADAEWKTDEEAVLKVIKGADYIFAGHSHHDHIGDVPFIARRFGSKVIGSRTTANLALTGGVDKSQVITISGGENLDFKDFSVQVIESRHGWLKGRPPRKENAEITGRGRARLEAGISWTAGASFTTLASVGGEFYTKARPTLSKKSLWDCVQTLPFWRSAMKATTWSAY